MLRGIYLRGLLPGFLLGATFSAAPYMDGVVLALGAVFGVAMAAVVAADIRQLVREESALHEMAERRGVVSTEDVVDDDVWGNEA